MKRHERLAFSERGGGITLRLPWPMGYTRRASAKRSDPAHEATDAATSDAAKFKRASPACRHSRGVTVAVGSPLTEPRAPGSEAPWERVKSKLPEEDKTSVSEAAAAAVAASTSGWEEGSGAKWYPGGSVQPSDRPRGPKLSERAVWHRKRRPALFALTINHQDYFRAAKTLSLVLRSSRSELSTTQAPFRRSSAALPAT